MSVMPRTAPVLARWIALLLPLALLGGAIGSQFLGGLVPCEMCVWQRWPHLGAILVALLAFFVRGRGAVTALVLLAALLIAASGVIGIYHAGTEYHWWQGITACTAAPTQGSAMDMLTEALRRPIVRCDVAQWEMFGISLAGYNAIFSLGGAALIALLATRRPVR
ncbi:disulfide bond formation protein B [Sphingomonas sp. HT-1]|uniref:disulfide bond formation protein B n=1 Tax=unclassified Sphingomonas TaxID=196159 RepID=UPI0003178FF4|nr:MULTISPECIES: disulfide bond formation protein B [unclassified Sphingomonas]KTF70482.1 disulfide bond formation protein [Sphingomonas sp. WG]